MPVTDVVRVGKLHDVADPDVESIFHNGGVAECELELSRVSSVYGRH